MDDFKNNQINDLILDLRYNSGGYISMSADLGTMIAGNASLGSVFTEITLNDKLSNQNTIFRFASNSSSNLSVPYGTELDDEEEGDEDDIVSRRYEQRESLDRRRW